MREEAGTDAGRLLAATGTVGAALLLLIGIVLAARSAVPAAAHPVQAPGAPPVPPPAMTVTLVASPTLPTVYGSVALTATVKNELGGLLTGEVITFSTLADLGSGGFAPKTDTTDVEGEATSMVSSTLPGPKKLIARASNGVTGTVIVTFSFRVYLPVIMRNYPPPWELGAGSAGKSVFHIAVCLDDPQILYAGTDGQGVLKSTDGGASWTGTALANELVFAPAIEPGGCDTVYATTWGNSVKKSTDGGTSWDPANTGLGDSRLYFAVADLSNPGTVYVASFSDGVYKTTDHGASWSQAGLAGKRVIYLTVDPSTSSRIYASVYGEGVYKTESAGGVGNWTEVSSGLAGDKILRSLSVAANTGGDVALAASTDKGVFVTTDGGGLWQQAWPAGYLQTVYTVLALDLDGQLTFFAGTNGAGVYRSTDGGNSWGGYSSGLGNLAAQFLSSGGEYIFLGTGNGAYRRQPVP